MALGLTQPLKEINTRDIFWGKGGRCVGLTILPPSCVDFLEICEPQPSRTPLTYIGLYRNDLTFCCPYLLSVLGARDAVEHMSVREHRHTEGCHHIYAYNVKPYDFLKAKNCSVESYKFHNLNIAVLRTSEVEATLTPPFHNVRSLAISI